MSGPVPKPFWIAAGLGPVPLRLNLSHWQDRDRSSAEVKALALARADDLGPQCSGARGMKATLLDSANRCYRDGRPDCSIIESLAC
ncbi:hypothetical protein E2493_02810 [Sphingomonas parva]|uniref:Uncharacterized protein n=1 Tax=Sphingomonas parva TaxID=2555898 RepID=A0A4Y8ZYQ6_9SPHN|nr:hypothetical protein [Sphingomonas parva]TFI59786.1 hypothetical protein E2493_02810 [Sphingomonas parva]